METRSPEGNVPVPRSTGGPPFARPTAGPPKRLARQAGRLSYRSQGAIDFVDSVDSVDFSIPT